MRRALRLPYIATEQELFTRRDGPSPEHRRVLEIREAMACVHHWVGEPRAFRELVRLFHDRGGSFQHGVDENRRRVLLTEWLQHQIDVGFYRVAELHPPPPLPPNPKAKEAKVVKEEFIPPTEKVEDIFLLVAEVKLIGDTPLINHAVRILDPDTGEVVAEDKTNENGVVRTEVPKKKTYRIEIVDDHHDQHEWNTVHVPHPMLRVRFVDSAGSPVPHLEVTVKDLEGNAIEAMADEDGLLEMPAHLTLHEVLVGDDAHWVHALLHRDGADDAYEIVVASQLEEGMDGIDPDDRLTRSWDHSHDLDGGDDDGDYA